MGTILVMKVSALLFLVSSLASSTFGEGGLYFDEGEVALACTAGTALGAKLADAMESCFNEFEGAETEEMNGDVTMRKNAEEESARTTTRNAQQRNKSNRRLEKRWQVTSVS